LRTLRSYQRDAINKIFGGWDEGLTRIAISIATGGGKSVIFGETCRIHLDRFPKPGPVVLLVHRRELVAQAAGHFRSANPDLKVEVVIGSPGPRGSTKRARTINKWKRADVLCTTPQTLGSQTTLSAFPLPSLIIVDESHRSMAAQYTKVLKALGAFSGTRTLGVTATPFREDYREYTDVFQKIVANVDISWLIAHNDDENGNAIPVAPGKGFLVPPTLHHLLVDGLDLSKVPLSKIGGSSDFRGGALAEAMEEAGAFKLVVDAINSPQFADRKRIAVFAPTVESSKFLADALNESGTTATHIDGETPNGERERRLQSWRRGDVRCTSNVNVLTEGYDLPDIDMVVLARPTKSRIFFRQAIGRGLRPAPGKTDCIVLDVCGASDGQSLSGVESLTDVETVRAGRNESLSDLLDRTERERRGRLDRLRALADRAKEIAEAVARTRTQVTMTANSLKEDMPGVMEFADQVIPPADEVAEILGDVAKKAETISELLTLTELSDMETEFNSTINGVRSQRKAVEDVKVRMRNALATAQAEPESEVAKALVTGNVRTVRGNLFGEADEFSKPGAPGSVQEMQAKKRSNKAKPVVEQRYGWALTTQQGHLYAPIHLGKRNPTAWAIAVKLGEDRFLPCYLGETGDADTLSEVTTLDDAYAQIVEYASKETEALNLLNPQAAWRKATSSPASKAWGYALTLNPGVQIPEGATAGYVGDLITMAKAERVVNDFAAWVKTKR
jgi:superfamily II DNA or RNA helicase